MTARWKNPWLAAAALVIAVNAIVLGGAAYNRSGEPASRLVLTERELRPSSAWRGNREDSSMALRLRWRVLSAEPLPMDQYIWYYDGGGLSPAWLDTERVAALGFDTTLSPDHFDASRWVQREQPRHALVVLELDGPARQQSLERIQEAAVALERRGGEPAKQAPAMLERELTLASRLFAVDAGLDRTQLRQKYPDRARYAIVAAQVRPALQRIGGKMRYSGTVSALDVGQVHVPLQLQPVFQGALPDDYEPGTRPVPYGVTVAWGHRLEPWIEAAERK